MAHGISDGMLAHVLPALLLAAALAAPSSGLPAEPLSGVGAPCPPLDQWAAQGRPLSRADALARAARADVVLLGERHGTPGHHRWQAATIAALAATGRPVVIGLEQLQPAAQPALDQWVAGTLDEAGFRAASRWDEDWGFDFAAYRPVFQVARSLRIPIHALNVDREFVRRVGREGFDAAAAQGSAPIARPAPAPPAYLARLDTALAAHGRPPSPGALERFAQAQTVWDRAMAEGAARALAARPGVLVVVLTGHGHVEGGHGVAHQLADLGHTSVFSAIAVDAGASPCPLPADAADVLFGAMP